MGAGSRSRTSISKTTKRTASKKNRREKLVWKEDPGLNPHSNGVLWERRPIKGREATKQRQAKRHDKRSAGVNQREKCKLVPRKGFQHEKLACRGYTTLTPRPGALPAYKAGVLYCTTGNCYACINILAVRVVPFSRSKAGRLMAWRPNFGKPSCRV